MRWCATSAGKPVTDIDYSFCLVPASSTSISSRLTREDFTGMDWTRFLKAFHERRRYLSAIRLMEEAEEGINGKNSCDMTSPSASTPAVIDSPKSCRSDGSLLE